MTLSERIGAAIEEVQIAEAALRACQSRDYCASQIDVTLQVARGHLNTAHSHVHSAVVEMEMETQHYEN